MTYFRAIELMPEDKKAIHTAYHNRIYGFPIHDDNELFSRLVLEINQAGLRLVVHCRPHNPLRQISY